MRTNCQIVKVLWGKVLNASCRGVSRLRVRGVVVETSYCGVSCHRKLVFGGRDVIRQNIVRPNNAENYRRAKWRRASFGVPIVNTYLLRTIVHYS